MNALGIQTPKKSKQIPDFLFVEEIQEFLTQNCREGDLLITMGAGNVVEIGEALLKGSK